MIRRLLHEPLVHFAAIGIVLFLLFDVAGGDRGTTGRAIVVDERVAARLVEEHVAVWKRPPTAAEMRGLIDNWVREEIAYREGITLGLDRGDPVIRRRVRQKVDVLADESGRPAPPTDAELQAWLQTHPEPYALPAVLDFEQAVLDPGKHSGEVEIAIGRMRTRLEAGASASEISEARMLPTVLRDAPLDVVAREFGDPFAEAIRDMPVGTWHGPVRSGLGLHLVKITARKPGGMPPLEAVKSSVARDVESARRTAAADAYYAKLREKYEIRVEPAVAKATVKP